MTAYQLYQAVRACHRMAYEATSTCDGSEAGAAREDRLDETAGHLWQAMGYLWPLLTLEQRRAERLVAMNGERERKK